MFHAFDVVTNTKGDSLVGYQVLVRDPTTGAVIPIFADDNGTPIGTVSNLINIALTDNAGNYSFFVPFGTYNLEFRTPDGVSVRTINSVPFNSGSQGAPGRDGLDGNTGPANSTFPSVAGITNAPITNLSAIRADGQGGLYTYTTGDFTGQVDNNLVIASGQVPITTGAWVLNTTDYVPAWSTFEQVIVPVAYTRVTTGGFYPQGIYAARSGGASYRLDEDQTTTTSTAWRKKSKNGRWFVLDEQQPSLPMFGCKSGGDRASADANEAPMHAAFDWLNQEFGRRLFIPRATWGFTTDLRVLKSGACIQGFGADSVLKGWDNARLMFGQCVVQPPNSGSNGVNNKGGIEVLSPRCEDFTVAPDYSHNGEIVCLDFTQNAVFRNVDVGAVGVTGTNGFDGIKTRWTQYTSFYNCTVNVNGNPFLVSMENINPANEDHFTWIGCEFYLGKPRRNNFPSAGILIDWGAGRSAGMLRFTVISPHFARFIDVGRDGTVNAQYSGIAVRKRAGDNTDTRAILGGIVIGGYFENVQRCFDTLTFVESGNDLSHISFDGTNALNFDFFALGKDISKGTLGLSNTTPVQGNVWIQGMRAYFGMGNRPNQVTTLFADYAGFHRFADKESGGSVITASQATKLKRMGSVTVPNGATTITVTHGLSKIGQGQVPTTAIYTPVCEGWAGNPFVSGEDRSAGTVTFDFVAPTADKILSWTAEIPEE